MANDNARRNFLKKASVAGVAMVGLPSLKSIEGEGFEAASKNDQLVFLFQGDSITDGNRGRSMDPNHILGHGYAFSIASKVGATYPEKQYLFFNRGISGNRVADLAARWQKDTLDIKPDVLSILIGVNDAASLINKNNSVTVEQYEATYRALLQQTKEQLPNCLLVLCEPFILPNAKLTTNWDAWTNDLQKRQEVVRRLAKEFSAVFVPLQKVFDDANPVTENYWIWDGIHPTYAGHALITKSWLHEVGKHLHFLKHTKF